MGWVDYDRWEEILGSLSRHKMRTALTALGVFWGLFMLVLLMAASSGLENGVEYEFRDDANNSLWIRPGRTTKPWKGLPEGRQLFFSNTEFSRIAALPGVEHATARYYLSGDQTVTYGDKVLSFPVRAVHPGHQYLENTIMVEGRYLNDQDVEGVRKVAVIGERLKDELFGDENDVIGKELQIGSTMYTIVGLYTDTGSEYETRVLYIPVSTAQRIYAGTDRVHQILLTTGEMPFDDMQVLEQEIRQLLAASLIFDPEDQRAIWVNNRAEEYREITGLLRVIRLFGWLVSLGSILAGIIGVSNIMLIIVRDRTREIGIRKALGSTPASVVGMILQEALVITSVAGYLGICCGVLVVSLLRGIEEGYFRSPEVDWKIAFSALIVLVISGLLAGWMPARRASHIHPVEAMKA